MAACSVLSRAWGGWPYGKRGRCSAEGWTKQAFPRSPTQTGACASVLRRSQPALEERVRPRKLSFTEEMPRVALASEEKG